MKLLKDVRLWVGLIAAAFVLLWCMSIVVTYAVPAQEPLPDPIQTTAPQIRLIGILGWGLVGVGLLGVLVAAVLNLTDKPKPRRHVMRTVSKPSSPYKVMKSVYTPAPPHRYQRRAVERRYR